MKIQPGFIPDRILDLLRIDGGWLTTAADVREEE